MPEMINMTVQYVWIAKAQWQYLMDNVTAANLVTNISATHSDKQYVFIRDYIQNIELPFLRDQEPGEIYYLAPKSVYILGMVDMAHKYNDVVQSVGEQWHTHVYSERRVIRVVTMLLLL